MDAASSSKVVASDATDSFSSTPNQSISYIDGQKPDDFLSDTAPSDSEDNTDSAVYHASNTDTGTLETNHAASNDGNQTTSNSSSSTGIPLPTASRSNLTNQYQYLQQQQLAQQAYAKQLQGLQTSEPVGIHHQPAGEVEEIASSTTPNNNNQTISQVQQYNQQNTPSPRTDSASYKSHSAVAASGDPGAAPGYASIVTTSVLPNQTSSHVRSFSPASAQQQQPASAVDSQSFQGNSSLQAPQQLQHNRFTSISSSYGYPPTSSPTASSYFSTSSTSRFVPNTNEPSSVSSSYKSAVPPTASYHTAYSPYATGGSFSQQNTSSFHDRSLSNASVYFNTSSHAQNSQWASGRQNSVSSNASPSGMRPHTSPQSDPPFPSRSRIPSISESPFASSSFSNTFPVGTSSQSTAATSGSSSAAAKQPTIRTSLLTSKLAAAAAAATTGTSSGSAVAAASVPASGGPMSSSITPGGSSFPYPNPRSATGSFRKQLPSPRSGGMPSTSPFSHAPSSFGNSMSSSFGRQPLRNSDVRQSFLPHPSSTTTNISMATASGTSTPHSENSNDQQSEKGKTPQQPPASSGAMDVDEDNSHPADTHMETTPPPDPSRHTPAASQEVSVPPPSTAAATSTQRTLPEHLDIANFPVPDVIVMLTALLQKIIDANDTLHPHHYSQQQQQQQVLDFSNSFTANVLAFHGRNIPAIGLQAYLTRILKYCPTTNEVFISLLVYFDRIAQRANAGDFSSHGNTSSSNSAGGIGHGGDKNSRQLFVMDSYNIHRLIIAGVTVASKFFSDVFYKNSRYAKVGGLPVEELNHLELQFLLLTDFKLMIPLEELQRYADLLLGFWKKEQTQQQPAHSQSQQSSSSSQVHQAQAHT